MGVIKYSMHDCPSTLATEDFCHVEYDAGFSDRFLPMFLRDVTSFIEMGLEDRGRTFFFCGEQSLLPPPPSWFTVESFKFHEMQ
jgi:hypothetical protein